ncbi:MAG: SDR family NAD(P)-dependent oxidoreductase [Polyangiales bacterium]
MTEKPRSAHDVDAVLAYLEAVVEDRGLLADLDEATRQRFLMAAGRVSRPDRAAMRDLAKAFRKKEKEERKRHDAELLGETGIRRLRSLPVFETPPPPTGTRTLPSEEAGPELREARKCYVCKREFTKVHPFYDQMCPECGDFNFAKRTQTADLRGRTALVTGARVKIGYQASILLLRAGCRVIATTRFPHDAALRYAREADFHEWKDRLVVHGLDLRHTPSVELFAKHLESVEERLDFVIHNACQTVRRPSGFYAHLVEREREPLDALPAEARSLLDAHDDLRARRGLALAEASAGLGLSSASLGKAAGLVDAPGLSQLELLDEDRLRGGAIFPEGELDADLQQVDRRERNSWRMTLAEVPTVELLEVQLVNAIAPFVLNARLKPLMLRHRTDDKHIVNVSAMEGQFYRDHKTDKHPHTNMAKAALNMMTRTSAADYVKDGIHMNSVDTGWVTDEDPVELAARKVEEHGFHPPLDIVDGAARIVDPIFSGFLTGTHPWGLFLKDYKPVPW